MNRYIRQYAAQAAEKEVKALGVVRQAVADRLRAADVEEAVPVEEVVFPRVMTELCWRVTLRYQNESERVFTGGPFAFEEIEAAFNAIADTVELAIKAAKAPVASKV